MTKKAIRRSGVVLDREQLDYQLGLRACTSRELARRAGVHEVLLSRARHGHPITEASFRKITRALLKIPLHPGADLLLARPKGGATSSTAIASTAPAAAGQSNGAQEKKEAKHAASPARVA